MAYEYFEWLYGQLYDVNDIDSPHSYTVLCYHMDQIEFMPSIPNDDNRVSDAIQLRLEFREGLSTAQLTRFESWEWDKLFDSAPTIFEVLGALARRAEFMVGRDPKFWFTEFVANLKLHGYSDEAFEEQDRNKINRILRRFNERRYDMYGKGGICPLKEAEEDQRYVELWYQVAAYAGENRMY